MTLLEVCVDDVAGTLIAEQTGADRVELCTGLSDGGTTPSLGTVASALSRVRTIGVNVLIRQRPGDFVYDEDEADAMLRDVRAVRRESASAPVPVGFVLGALGTDGEIDRWLTTRLVDACDGAPVTFHKAFDQTPDLSRSLETVVASGVSRVLTSGGCTSAIQGAQRLGALVEQAGERVRVMAGGGVRPQNVAELARVSGVPEVHLRAAEELQVSQQRGRDVGGYLSAPRMVTSRRILEQMMHELGRGRPQGGAQ